MKLNLPVHPTMRHPLTGAPLQALYVDSRGRARYPIMGAAPDDGGGGDTGGDSGGDKGGGDSGGDAGDKGQSGDQSGGGKPAGSDDGKDLGFPKDTPVAEMSPVQQIAYYKHQSRRHEQRATAYHQAAGGKTAAEVKADLEAADTLRREKLNDQERAVEDAKREAREAAAREHGPKSVRAAFDLLLGDLPQEERDAEIDVLDLSKFLNDNGDVDTAKVRKAAEKLAPAGKGGEQRIRNFGAGDRRTDKSSGVASGRDLFRERHGKTTTSTTN